MKLRTVRTLKALFPNPASVQTVSPAILRFALGRSLCDTHIASDQFHLWSATWSPQVGTCFCRYHPMHYYTQSTKGIRRWGWLLRTADGKRWWGGTTNESWSHGSATMGHWNLIYWYHRPSCSCSGRTPSIPGHAVRTGLNESNGRAWPDPNC